MTEGWTSVIGAGDMLDDVGELSTEEEVEEVGVVGILKDITLEKVDSCAVEFTVAWEPEDCVTKDEKVSKAEGVDCKRLVEFREIEGTVDN